MLTYNESIASIWPVFGTVNQLVAVTALCIGTILLLEKGKKRYSLVTLIPLVFLGITAFDAGISSMQKYIADKNYCNTAILGMILIFTLIVIVRSILKWRQIVKSKNKETNRRQICPT